VDAGTRPGHYEWVQVSFIPQLGVKDAPRENHSAAPITILRHGWLANQYRIGRTRRWLRGRADPLAHRSSFGRFDPHRRWWLTSKVPAGATQGQLVGNRPSHASAPRTRCDQRTAGPTPDSTVEREDRSISQNYASAGSPTKDLAKASRALGWPRVRAGNSRPRHKHSARTNYIRRGPGGRIELQARWCSPQVLCRRLARNSVSPGPKPFYQGISGNS